MKKRESGAPPAVGGSALPVIFGVLCLTVFALLSLSTALSQQRLADRALENVTAYYEADLLAETVFARLRTEGRAEGVMQEGSRYAYTVQATDIQALHVELEQTHEGWQVLRWQLVPEAFEIDDHLNVWDGGEDIN